MPNNSNDGKRHILQDRRQSIALERRAVMDQRKQIQRQRSKLHEQEYSAARNRLEFLIDCLTQLQDRVHQLQMESDQQRQELRVLKRDIDKILPNLSQDMQENRMKRAEDWQTFYEAGQTLTENRQDQREQLMALQELRKR